MMSSLELRFLGPIRDKLLRGTSGRVLEIGGGTGANLRYYGDRVGELILCEPDGSMRKILAARAETVLGGRCRIEPWSAEAIDLPDASCDAIVSTLVLCSVGDPAAVFAEIRRVLVPGGKLLYMEHVCPWTRPRHRRALRVIEPFWKLVAGNCHLTRATGQAMEVAGFTNVRREVAHFPRPANWVGPVIWGEAEWHPDHIASKAGA